MYLKIFFYCCLSFILISTASASQLQEDPNYKELLSRYGTMANMKSIFTSVSPKEHLLTDPYIHNEKLTYQVKVFSKKSGNENFTQTVQTNFYDNKFYIVKVDIFNKKKDFMNLTTIYKNDFLPLILNYREGDNNTLHSEDFILWDWTENYRFKKSIRMKSPNYTKMKYDITE